MNYQIWFLKSFLYLFCGIYFKFNLFNEYINMYKHSDHKKNLIKSENSSHCNSTNKN